MPHKRNPFTCEAVVGVSRALRYNAAFMLECMVIEHGIAFDRVLMENDRARGADARRAARGARPDDLHRARAGDRGRGAGAGERERLAG